MQTTGVQMREDDRQQTVPGPGGSVAYRSTLLDAIPDMAWLKDLDGVFLAVNQSFAAVCGLKPAEVLGKTDFDLWPVAVARRHQTEDRKVQSKDRSTRVEEQEQDAGCEARWFETIRAPVHDRTGAVIGLAGSVRDITVRKKAEESQHRFQMAVDDAGDAVLTLGAAEEVTYVNVAVHELLRHTQDTLNEHGWQVVFVDPEVARSIVRTIRALDKWVGEAEIRRGDGQTFPAEIRAAPIIGEAAAVLGTMLFVNDIGPRRQAEAERLKRAELERERDHLRAAVKAHDRILGVVGHELRTPLAGIRVMTELLLEGASGQAAEAQSFLRSINDEIIRMAGLVNDLLEVARMNSGTAQWNWSQVILAEACKEAVESIKPLVDCSRVLLRHEVIPPDAVMAGDPAAIRRLVLNLLSNANKHTADGQIGICVERTERDGAQWIDLRVSDTGSGMPPEIAERLGVAFALNSGAIGESHVRGAGLGMAIAKGIVVAHGGTIAVETSPGRGTTISVRMRADLPAPNSGEDAGGIVLKVQP